MKDILLDKITGDLVLASTDLGYTESTEQHQRDILLARKGDYRQAARNGVGIADMLLDEDRGELTRLIRTELAKDGQKVNRIQVVQQNVKIDAHY